MSPDLLDVGFRRSNLLEATTNVVGVSPQAPEPIARQGTKEAKMDFNETQAQLSALCQRFGITELSVFGSVARGDDRPESDLDLLYVHAEGAPLGLLEIITLQEELEDLFDRPVDLVAKRYLNESIRDEVLHDAQVLYAA
ncbi:nucleotidyltransferase family protein [Streptosporangium sp. NPDC020072]|uniref:nucleotidyltransferase family protein n=1 Tax=Streptosporangium sp. NPDC020072 TaxID=3154788 RepID=UPI003432BCE2